MGQNASGPPALTSVGQQWPALLLLFGLSPSKKRLNESQRDEQQAAILMQHVASRAERRRDLARPGRTLTGTTVSLKAAKYTLYLLIVIT